MLLKLNNVSKGYGIRGTHAFRPVLENLSWQAEAGSRICIAGPSGSGKTTLLNLVGALDLPDSGEIFFGDRDISKYNADELALFRNQSLGFVFQQHLLLPQLTLMENVLLPLLPAGNSASKEKRAWAEHLLKKTGIWEQRDQKPSQMSGGECQRTAVVRAMINKPVLILADEPTGALDEANATILADLLINLSLEEGITLITVTHSAELAAKMDTVFHLKNGRLESQPLTK